MEAKNRYRYELTDRFGTLDVAPLNEANFSIEWGRETDGKYFYSKTFNGKISFRGEIFSRLRRIEKSVYICTEQRLQVFRKCGSTESLYFDGYFKLTEGEWLVDRCEVILKFEKNVPDKCLEQNKNVRVNLFQNIFNRITVKTAIAGGGVFEYLSYVEHISHGDESTVFGGYIWNGVGTPEAGNWRVYFHEERASSMLNYNPNDPQSVLDLMYDAETKWVREVVTQDSAITPPAGWVLLEDNTATLGTKKYAKPANLINCTSTSNIQDQWNYERNYSCNILGSTPSSGSTIDNGVSLSSVLTLLVSQFCPDLTVVSDFFQINPENASPVNYVTGQASQVNEIVLFQKSDVKRPAANNNASKAEITFEKLIEALATMFNVYYRVENGIFRLEHISWYSRNAGLDLRLPRYAKYVRAKNGYTYDGANIPARETWSFKEQSASMDWRGEIEYNNACAVVDGRNNEKKYSIDDFMTDVALALNNPSSDSNVVEDAGFVIVATKIVGGVYYIISEDDGAGTFNINNTLGWRRLVRNYHFHERYLKNGSFNDSDVEFITTRPFKKGDKIEIPLCCSDVFKPEDFITTKTGEAIVESATFNLLTETLEIVPLYDVFEGLTENDKPVISATNATTYKETPISIPITVSDADGFVVSIQVKTPPLHGSVIVNGTTEVIYSPAAGYVGNDFFHLVASDDWSEISDTAAIMVNVLQTNQAPTATNDNYNVFHGETFSSGAGILANDGDDVGFTLITTTATTAQGITVNINANGTFNYTPPTGFEGVDSFDYTIEDGAGLQSSATVFLNVGYKNKPVAVDDSYNARKNTTLTTDGSAGKRQLFYNDYTPDGNAYSYTTNVETKATAQGGTVSITSNGLFTYNPPSNFVGSDSFDYTVNNPNGSDVGLVTINVLPEIYVRLSKLNSTKVDGVILCGEPPQATPGGINWHADYRLNFYSDAGGTIPMDVTGLGMRANIAQTQTPGSNSTWETGVLSGTQIIILEDFYYYEEIVDCNGFIGSIDRTIALAPGNYTIIT